MKNERTDCRTNLLYETDAYITRFQATVTDLKEGPDGELGVELNETAFFPEGGGQSADTGILAGLQVKDVQRDEGRVWHILEKKAESGNLKIGDEVDGEVDFSVRFRRMQNHLAEHLFCGIAHKRFGYDNVGFHLSDVVTFDLDGPLTAEEIRSIETKCNEVIWENVPVRVSFPESEELDRIEFRSKLELSEGVRLVEIEGYDLCACCAPALHSTGEIGVIKVLDYMPHRGGTRLTLLAGPDALADYQNLDDQFRALMKQLSAGRKEVAAMAEEFGKKALNLHAENTELKKEITGLYAERVQMKVASAKEEGKRFVCFFLPNADEVQVRNVINETVKTYDGILCGFRGSEKNGFRYVCGRKEASEEVSLRELARQMKDSLGGSGGGSEVMIQGQAPASADEILAFFQKIEDGIL